MKKIYEVQHIKQVVREVEETWSPIASPTDAVEMIQGIIGDVDREVLLVLVLNTKNRVVAIHQAHTGSLNSSIVHPREVFKAAILNNGASIIVSHNHPSGDTEPSEEDILITKRLQKAGTCLGIQVLDHLIVSQGTNYTSLRERGDMS